MTTLELKRLTRKWQERLRLQDWDVTVRFAKKGEHEDTWGLCINQSTTKQAAIVMSNPRWHSRLNDPDLPVPDIEATLVHELMHLHFSPFGHSVNTVRWTIEEVIVSHVAQLLVALDRGDEMLINPQNPRHLSRVARFRNGQDKH